MQPALPTCSEGMAGPAKTWGLQPSWCRAVTQRKQANRPNRDYRSPCQREETALLHTLFFFRVTFFFFFFFFCHTSWHAGLFQWLSCLQCRRRRFNPWVGKIPWRRTGQPTPVVLPGESHGRRSLAGSSPWGCNESATTEVLEHAHTACTLDLHSSASD